MFEMKKRQERQVEQAMGAIHSTLSDPIDQEFKSEDTPKKLWDAIKKKYSIVAPSQTLADVRWCFKFILNTRKNPMSSIAELKSRFLKIKAAGVDIPETLQTLIL